MKYRDLHQNERGLFMRFTDDNNRIHEYGPYANAAEALAAHFRPSKVDGVEYKTSSAYIGGAGIPPAV